MVGQRGRAYPVTTLAAGAAVTLALAGCGASGGGAATEPTSTAPPRGDGSPSAPAVPTSAPEPAATGTAEDSASVCGSGDLEVALGRAEGAAGTVYRPLEFTNTADAPCVIGGHPGVSYVTEEDGDQVGAAAAREGGPGPAVTLRPGDTASATVGFTRVADYDEDECDPTDTRGLRVYPPRNTGSVFVAAQGRGCADPDVPGDQLTVTSVQADGAS
ncbi:Uncharacterised protein [Nocardiopsis dassonvillei]|uniref:DUF4232 domain-containing protein n=2 Tax=Nocardiopsis TaxID=2013 RepID=D7B4G7_NOCDD|nr:conserved hypothetical protein [Nocardiopsis dassonvillei subsp. dassonvillei DSM 43111]VEI89472.1 Uncharacterised protein [Nocardiopsis dassonvillei]